jgi:hypothetical protein
MNGQKYDNDHGAIQTAMIQSLQLFYVFRHLSENKQEWMRGRRFALTCSDSKKSY